MTMDVNVLVGLLDATNQARAADPIDELISLTKTRNMPLLILGERAVAPRVAAAYAIDPTTVLLFFNMRMNPTDIAFLPYYTITEAPGSAPRFILSIDVDGPSNASFVTLHLDGPLSSGVLNYTVTVDTAVRQIRDVELDPAFDSAAFSGCDMMALSATISPAEGPVTGGTLFQISGNVVDVSGCSDSFSDGVIGASWTNISAGGGSAREDGNLGALVLDTGGTAGAVAGIQAVLTTGDVDVEAVFGLRAIDRGVNAAARLQFDLGLTAPMSGSLRAQIMLERRARTFRIFAVVGAATPVDVRTIVGVESPPGVTARIRILRAGRRVYIFLNGSLIIDFEWTDDFANIEIRASNDPTLASQATITVTEYLRRPVVVFGSVPSIDIMARGAHVVGSTPRVDCKTDAVDVSVTGCGTDPVLIPDGWRFALDPELVRFQEATKELIVCNDDRLTKRRPNG